MAKSKKKRASKKSNGEKKLRTLHGYILIGFGRVPTEIKLPSGLFMPYSVAVAHKWRIAHIVALGDGIQTKSGKLVPYPYKVGDMVLVNRIFGDIVNKQTGQTETRERRIVSYDQIEGIIETEGGSEFWMEV